MSLAVVAVLVSCLYAQSKSGQEEVRSIFEEEGDPADAARWFFEQRAYPLNTLPPDYRFEAFNYVKKRWGNAQRQTKTRSAEATDRWIEIGPDNVGGRILSLALHPGDDNIVYAGAADGGVFKTIDGGQTWRALNDNLPSLAIKSLALDPGNPEVIYAGTGEGSFNIDAAQGRGVMKSTDGGATWTFGPAFSSFVNRLAINPNDTGIIYAATRNGVFRSTDGNISWKAVLSNHNCTDLSLDPSSPDNILVSVWDRAADTKENGIWRSKDGGTSWSRLEAGLPAGNVIGRVALARSRSSPQVVYAGVSRFVSNEPVMGIFKSTDGGQTWAQIAGTPSYCGAQCWYDNELTVHPTNPDILYAGGLFLWKSTNGGAAWSRSDVGVHVDHHALAISARNSNVVYSGNDGGMYRSTDGGGTWAALNYGLTATQFYALAMSATDPSLSYGGTQDNGTQKGSGPSGFQLVLGGDGMVSLVDPVDPNFVYAESQNGGLARSTNGGISFVNARFGILASDRFNWVTPWIIDPVNPQVLYVGSQRLYRSTNRAASWTAISNDLTRGTGTLTAIAVAPSDANTIYTGSSDGSVWKTTDGGSAPSAFRQIIAGLPNRWVTRLRVHPSDPQKVYATFSGFNGTGVPGHVFRSADGGETWVNISSELPDLPVQVIVIDPRNPSTLFIGTDLGCFRSLNEGTSWEPFNDGLPNVVVDDMGYFGNTNFLRVATHGRGMWQYTSGGRVPASIRVIAGNNQNASAVSDPMFPVRAVVLDSDGVPVPDAVVNFEITGGNAGGSFAGGASSAQAVSDRFGVVNLPSLKLSGVPGSITVTASAAGVASAAAIMINSVTSAPELTRIVPDSALAGQVIIAGQILALSGSRFAQPLFVYYIQNGTWYASAANTTVASSNLIYSTVPSGLAPGKASVVVSRGGELSNALDITINKTPTSLALQGLVPSAPSPGQQFLANFFGQQLGTERFTVTQGSNQYTGSAELLLFAGAVFTMPAFPFESGGAMMELRNHNASAPAVVAFNIPGQPEPPTIGPPAGARAPEQLLPLASASLSGFATVPENNVVTFSQGANSVEVPALAVTGGAVLAPIPGSFSEGTAIASVTTLLANGSARTNSAAFTIGPPPAANPFSVSPAAAAPGSRITLTSTSVGVFNTNPSRNTVLIRAGANEVRVPAETVNAFGTSFSFTLPNGLAAGPAVIQVTSAFGNQSYQRGVNAILSIVSTRKIEIQGGNLQVTDAGKPFPVPLSVKVTDDAGTAVPNAPVALAAPARGTSGFFENGGGPALTVITDTQGVASAVFKARNNGGSFFVRATISGQPAKGVFTLRSRNPANQRELSIPAGNAQVSETAGADAGVTAGYVTASASGARLVGVSIFSLRDRDGNLITEAAVPESVPSTSSLMFLDGRAGAQTGVALVNPNNATVTVSFRLFDPGGNPVGERAMLTLSPGAYAARFFSELFGGLSPGFRGTVLVESPQPVASVTLRAVPNARGQTILSTLPVAISSALRSGDVVFPHLAIGSGYRISVILLNPTSGAMKGKLRLFDSKGSPLGLESNPVIDYSIPAFGHVLVESSGAPGAGLLSGYAVASPDPGSGSPAGTLLFSNYSGNTLVTEAAVPASAAVSHALLYVDTQATELLSAIETRLTGIALANRGSAVARIRLILRSMDGTVLGIPRTIELEPGTQAARFVDELAGSLALGILGTLEVSSDRPIEMLTLRATLTARGELVLTTLPVADYAGSGFNTAVTFSHFADGGGYSSQAILLNASPAAGTITVRYFGPGGSPLVVDLR
jgi:photosystem II stability/assembly factor-like uncharacterized protein